MINFILLWFSISSAIYFVSIIRMTESLEQTHHVIPPMIDKRTHVVFDTVFIGYAEKRKGKVYQLGNASLCYDIPIAMMRVQHFISNNKIIKHGDIVLIDGYLDFMNGALVLIDVNFIAKKDYKLISKYLDLLYGKISIICMGVLLFLRYRVDLFQLCIHVKDLLISMLKI